MNEQQPILITARCDIQAADGQQRQPRIDATVYSGGIMQPPGWGALCIDLAGADLSGDIPILAGHREDLDAVVGQGRADVRGAGEKSMHLAGILSRATEAGAKVLALAQDGITLQASVGFQPDRQERIAAGQTVFLNGRKIEAPTAGLTVIRAGKLREVSLVPTGADRLTSVTISARGTRNMNQDSNIANSGNSTNHADVEIPDELRAAWDRAGLTDSQRVLARWQHSAIKDPSIRSQSERLLHAAIGGSMDFATFDREMLRAELRDSELRQLRASRPQSPEIRSSGRDNTGGALAAGVMIRAGYEGAARRQFGDQVVDGARHIARGSSLLDLAETCLRNDGIEKPASRDAMIKAALSSTSLPIALGQAGEKIILDAYQATPAGWKAWCKPVSVSSFREHSLLRPSFLTAFEEVGPGGELKHAVVGEEKATIRASTFAKLISISRQDLVNDDAGVFAQTAEALGRGAARRLGDLAIETLLAGVGTFFSQANNNSLSDSLSIQAVAKAIQQMRSQVDADGSSLDLVPKTLLVPPELESVARAICESDYVLPGEGEPTGNSLKGLLTPVVEPRLSNAIIRNSSATLWAVLAAPQDAAQAIAFLNGVQTPTIEDLGMSAEVDRLSYQWRGWFDFGSALVDWRAGVVSTGAGE